MFKIKGKYTNALVTIDELEDGAREQICKMCDHPAASNPIAIMPDTHLGKGCVIGFTMKVGDKIVPNWIGVDIGCGMLTAITEKPASHFLHTKQLRDFDLDVRKIVPMGFNIHRKTNDLFLGTEFYSHLNENIKKFHNKYLENYGSENAVEFKGINNLTEFETYLDKFFTTNKKGGCRRRILHSIGTLGGG